MAETSHDIRTLNSLIASLIDSINGYDESAKDADTSRYTEMFIARADERRACVASLREVVSRLGGYPEDDGTAVAAAHRAFINLKDAVTGKDDKAIISEVERGEDHLKSKFEDALKDDALSADVRDAISGAWHSVKAGHDEVSQLKHRLDA